MRILVWSLVGVGCWTLLAFLVGALLAWLWRPEAYLVLEDRADLSLSA
jgi:hypothetical protein